ncbi:hypothetical protein IMZ31_22135 (plasmid) [Pontibacillus sp. ALD_SL1]|uniref:hypothetical protein n=1 Tax=Pontibacillus sp. ALD_SL1 TaxID=2777185 RepID=UPI001A973B87|nr:hypothetical protein [Pontibacillus sp. ALD_SL1]QST02154.1 hypothetical protein IMZ31_22135 [Pontibacillus sp. ALD_SL1]
MKPRGGEQIQDYVRRLIIAKAEGEFKHNDFSFTLKGNETGQDFYLLMASYYLELARK